jgi:replication-associated recombination protein RarA
MYQPLAERMRPQLLAQVLGQEHLLAVGAPLQVLLARGQCPRWFFGAVQGWAKPPWRV